MRLTATPLHRFISEGGEDKLLALAVKEEKNIVLVIISVVKNQQEGLLKFQNPQPKGKIEIDILHFLSRCTVSPTLDFADFATYCL